MLWRWPSKPLVELFLGVATVKSAEANPGASCVVGLVSLLLFAWLVFDIFKVFNEEFHVW